MSLGILRTFGVNLRTATESVRLPLYFDVQSSWLVVPILAIVLELLFLLGIIYQRHHNHIQGRNPSRIAIMQIMGLKAPQALSPLNLTASSTKTNAKVVNVTLEQVGEKW